MHTFRVALAQINVTVGDLDGNTRKIISYIDMARNLGAHLVVFPEMAITGYPPEDLVFKPQFVKGNLEKMHEIARASEKIALVVGFVDTDEGITPAKRGIYNAAAIAYNGHLVDVYRKIRLPNYGVFDELRYFKPGQVCPVYIINGTAIGINICEDIWHVPGPATLQSAAGAEILVNVNGSPYHAGKSGVREEMLSIRASENRLFVAYVNLVGGQDELVFDGASMIFDPLGDLITRGSQFKEEMIVSDLVVGTTPKVPKNQDSLADFRSDQPIGEPKIVEVSEFTQNLDNLHITQPQPHTYDADGEVYAALVLGTRDYVLKNGFRKVLIALSGGIDSSLVAAIAVDALGNENVIGISMPSRFSSDGSIFDVKALAKNLDIDLKIIPIEKPFSSYLDTLAPQFEGTDWGIAEENIQSRIRGNLIMAMSNKFDCMVLTTGNKSEMATGYATIYGDMAGGFAVIKDVPKTLVYKLSLYRNRINSKQPIPQNVLEKPPSAELRPNQKDQDNLPPYSTLDPILKAYVEEDRTFDEMANMGFDMDIVKLVVSLVDRSEHKRRQAPPGIKITPRNFGRDRRMPISNQYRPF